MAGHINIPKRAFEGLDALLAIGPERLDLLADTVTDRNLTLDIELLAADLGTTVGFDDPERLATALSTVLIPLSGLRTKFRASPADFLQLLGKEIEGKDSKWYAENSEKWAKIVPALGKLLAPNGYFGLLYKTFGLLENHPAVVDEATVVTEIRPVYDEDVTATRALLLTSTLAISYTANGESKRIHLTLDHRDLQNLQEQLDRAEKKIQLFEQLADSLKVPLLISSTQ